MQVGMRMTRSSSARQASSAYLLSWMAVAVGGLAYLAVAAARPDLLSMVLPFTEPAQDQTMAGRTAADVSDEIASLRKWVHDLQHEVAATKSTIGEQSAQTQALAQRVAGVEERLAPSVREAKADTKRLPARPAANPAPAKAEPVRTIAPTAQTAAPEVVAAATPGEQGAGPNVRVLNAPAASEIVTGSLPETSAPVPGFGAAMVNPPQPQSPAAAPAASPRGIIIGNTESLEGLRARWSDLSARNAEELAALSPRYRLAGDGRQAPFSLLAGPFTSTTEAQRACASLKAKGVPCRVSEYSGNAF